VWLLGVGPHHAAQEKIWLCKGEDGVALYTNRLERQDCTRYEPTSGFVVASDKGERTAAYPVQVTTGYYPPRNDERRHAPEKRKPGEISFEIFRMLSTGMTEAEVLTRAGTPKYIFRYIFRNTQSWVYTQNDWLVEVTISGGRVANIAWYRPRP